jgi:hypothetical protein
MTGTRGGWRHDAERTYASCAASQLLWTIAGAGEVRVAQAERLADGCVAQVEHRQVAHIELPQAARFVLGADGASRRGAPLGPDRRDVEGGIERPRVAGAVVSG